jgi:hypothetical protein
MQHLGNRSRKTSENLVSRKVILPEQNCYDKSRRNDSARKKIPDYRILVRFQNQWTLLSRTVKLVVYALGVLWIQYILFAGWDLCYHRVGDDASNNTAATGGSFAVVINTYRRPDRLRDAVQHYADACGRRAGVSQVFVIWAEQGVEISEPLSFFSTSLRNTELPNNRAQVTVLQKAKDSLNSRFEPIDELTSKAVFMVDDDIRVACSSLTKGFDAWKRHPDAMVGYYPRLASPPLSDPKSSELIYHTWPIVFLRHKFNCVLTKASFLHSKYLALYSGEQFPQEARDHVDKHMNCEDIAMSMLVANYTKAMTGKPEYPIYVEGNVNDRGLVSSYLELLHD